MSLRVVILFLLVMVMLGLVNGPPLRRFLSRLLKGFRCDR